MESHLRSQRNVIVDRKEFHTRQQADGEPFDEYVMALKELAEFCDFCVHCADDRLRDRIVTGIRSLLSWYDAIALGIISPDFPKQIYGITGSNRNVASCYRTHDSSAGNGALSHGGGWRLISPHMGSKER
ncbi:hypothetical protein FJT64_016997 [Amphibalanus amphitrite]|uniref:Uncharacterized protein n=1 Tax=Amphibalanus amphitrite TaxID=1232801 RepID=A0A6A4X461_AMPAM|nr:hypothetical protein FJT64_016997 [Amphibalanus amphitrite]